MRLSHYVAIKLINHKWPASCFHLGRVAIPTCNEFDGCVDRQIATNSFEPQLGKQSNQLCRFG